MSGDTNLIERLQNKHNIFSVFTLKMSKIEILRVFLFKPSVLFHIH